MYEAGIATAMANGVPPEVVVMSGMTVPDGCFFIGADNGKLYKMAQWVDVAKKIHVLRNWRGDDANSVAFIREHPEPDGVNCADMRTQAGGPQSVIVIGLDPVAGVDAEGSDLADDSGANEDEPVSVGDKDAGAVELTNLDTSVAGCEGANLFPASLGVGEGLFTPETLGALVRLNAESNPQATPTGTGTTEPAVGTAYMDRRRSLGPGPKQKRPPRLAKCKTLRRPQGLGLSSRQMRRLLGHDWNCLDSAIQVRDHLALGELSEARFFCNSRTLLQIVHAQGGVKTTTAGNLRPAFVAGLCEALPLPPGYLERKRSHLPVVNEWNVREVHIPRVVLKLAGLMGKREGLIRVTRKGEQLLTDEAAGKLHAALLIAFFTKFNLAYLDHCVNESFQWTVGFALWLLGQGDQRWTSTEVLAPRLIHPLIRPDLAPKVTWHQAHMVLKKRLLEPLVGFGLLEHREVLPVVTRDQEYDYRRTPLFDRAFGFDLGPA